MTVRALVVSIHDVSPLTREATARILADLAGIGIPVTSLLVVPDHHRRGNITADPAFRAWLREVTAAGHEPVLHGYYHQRAQRTHESPLTRFFTRHYTAGEGEFFDISADAATPLLTRGRDELTQAAGRAPTGFIAPAWLLSPEGEAAARTLGFTYTTRLKSIIHLPTGRTLNSQSLCWSVRSQWRRTVSIAWNNLLFRALRANPVMRLSIHPPDIAHPAIWHQILALATIALREDHQPLTYAALTSELFPRTSPTTR